MKMRSACAAALAAVIAAGGSASAGKDNDTLTWAARQDIALAFPYYESLREFIIITQHVWDGLLYREPESLEYKPLLAESYRWKDDKTLEFKIRQGVRFHNGAALTADDVVETYNRVSAEDSGVLVRRNVGWIYRAEKVNSDTVIVHVKEPFPAALEYVSTALPIIPASVWRSVKLGANGKADWSTVEPIGTGPYKMTKAVAGQGVILEKNTDYFKSSPKGRPTIGKIVFRTIVDPEAQIAELLAGSVDWIWEVQKDKAEQLQQMPNITVVSAPTMRINFISMDHAGRGPQGEKGPFYNKKVRQAVAHAIDRDAIAKNVIGGASEKIHSACYPSQVGCTQNVIKYEYNPAKAKQLLTEAGYPNGFSADIYAYRNRPLVETVMGYLDRVGIKSTLRFLQYKTLRELTWDSKAPFSQLSWGSYSVNDVSAITSLFFKFGPDDYCRDAEVRDLLEKGDTSTNANVRNDAYANALMKISQEVCWLPLVSDSKYYAFSKNFDFKPTADELPQFYSAKWK